MTQSFLQAAQIGDAGFVQPQQYADTVTANTQAFQQDLTNHFSQLIEIENNRGVQKDTHVENLFKLTKSGIEALKPEFERINQDKQYAKWYEDITKLPKDYNKDLGSLGAEINSQLLKRDLLINAFKTQRGIEDLGPEHKDELRAFIESQTPYTNVIDWLNNGANQYTEYHRLARRSGDEGGITLSAADMDPKFGLNIEGMIGKDQVLSYNDLNSSLGPNWRALKAAWLLKTNRLFVRQFQGNETDGWTDHRLINRYLMPRIRTHNKEFATNEEINAEKIQQTAQKTKDVDSALSAVTNAFQLSSNPEKAKDTAAAALTSWYANEGSRYGGGSAAADWLRNELVNRANLGMLSEQQLAALDGALDGRFIGNDGGVHSLTSSFVPDKDGRLVEKPGYWPTNNGLQAAVTQARKKNLQIREQETANERTNWRVLSGQAIDRLRSANAPVDAGVLVDIARGRVSNYSGILGEELTAALAGGWQDKWGTNGYSEWFAYHDSKDRVNVDQKARADYLLREGMPINSDILEGMNQQNKQYYGQFVSNPLMPQRDPTNKLLEAAVTTHFQSEGHMGARGIQYTATLQNVKRAFWDRVTKNINDGISDADTIYKDAWKHAVTEGLGEPGSEGGHAVAKVDSTGALIVDNPNFDSIAVLEKAVQGDQKAIINNPGIINSEVLPYTPTDIKKLLVEDGKRGYINPKVESYYRALAHRVSDERQGGKTINWWAIANAQYRQIRSASEEGLPPTGQFVNLPSTMRTYEGLNTKEELQIAQNPRNTADMTYGLVNNTMQVPQEDGSTVTLKESPAKWFSENLQEAEAIVNGGINAFTYGPNGGSISDSYHDSSNTKRRVDDLGQGSWIQPVSSMNLGQIVNQMDQGYLGKVGIYGLNKDQILRGLEAGDLTPETVFDEATQIQLLLNNVKYNANINAKAAIGVDISWLALLTPIDELVALEQNVPWANRRENLLPDLHGDALARLSSTQTPV